MRGTPYKSKLEPHYDLIKEMRSRRCSWPEVVNALKERGIIICRQAVVGYFKRRRTRRVPMGWEPDEVKTNITERHLPRPLPGQTGGLRIDGEGRLINAEGKVVNEDGVVLPAAPIYRPQPAKEEIELDLRGSHQMDEEP